MSLEFAAAALTALVSVGVSILLAGVPWAYSVHGRLTKIETTLTSHLSRLASLDELEHRVTRLEFLAARGEE